LRLVFHILAALLTACLVAIAFFSMFGKNWEGPWKSISAYANYFRRGSQQGDHSEPWYYYLQILFAYRPAKRIFWSEGFIAVLALVGGVYAIVVRTRRVRKDGTRRVPPTPPSPALLRFLTFYTFLLTLLYCLISYKTPWCVLSFHMGMILLAGVGAAAILRVMPNRPTKLVAALVLAVGAGHLGWQAYQLNFNPRFIADPLNPYVYAHTPPPLPRLAALLDRFADRVPEGHDMLIQVVVRENYWPLPWYLRKFNEERVGYWLDPTVWKQDVGDFPSPAILIASREVDCDDPKMCPVDYGSLRPGVMIAVYVRADLEQTYKECKAEKPPSLP
jgi:predicted membrane-bound mannosyltransferase